MIMKRKSSSKREAMERMELSSEATRLLSDVQYLRKRSGKVGSEQSLLTTAEEGWRQRFKTGHNTVQLSMISVAWSLWRTAL